MVREHLVERGLSYQKQAGQGMISKHVDFSLNYILCVWFTIVYKPGPSEMMNLRWNSQHGNVYVDGSHMKVTENKYNSRNIFFLSYCFYFMSF